jgi:phosphomevalonate kinase
MARCKLTMTEMQINATAPGKLVLSGEYAVLEGAPAICMAIDRRARVTVAQTGDDVHIVSAPGYADGPRTFRYCDGKPEWLDDGAGLSLIDAVWSALDVAPAAGLSLQLDTSEFVDPQNACKMGIGSSAALTAALTAALDAPARAYAAHSCFQGGRGSGVDIACSQTGGVIEYVAKSRDVRPLNWPQGLASTLIWSGTPASTAQKLDRLAQSRPRPSRAALVYSSRRLASAWRQGSVDRLLNEYRDYIQVLREFSIDHDLGIFDAGHDELTALAATAGVVYKPCGAGGGDVGIALAADAAALDAFADEAKANNYKLLDANLDPLGVQVERNDFE